MILNSQDMAFVANKLQVPLIMGDVLNNRASLSDSVEYGLHEVLSEFQPDSALLAIALSAKTIAGSAKSTSPHIKILEMECNRIIQDYGTIWVQNAQSEAVDVDQIYDILVHTTDDLEAIAELLELNVSTLRQKDETAAQLCTILHIQAKAQAMVADAFMIVAEEKAQEEDCAEVIPAPAFTAAALSDNVIPFPASTTN